MAFSTSQGAVISISVDGAAQSQGQIDGIAQSMNSLATRTGTSAAQMANAMRMVPAQLTDIVVGLQAGQAPLTVLLQQGGQLRDMFGSSTAAARGVAAAVLNLVNPYTVAAAAVGALAYAYNEGSKEADAYNRAIIMSGNVAGTSKSQLADMAREISKSAGTQAEAAQAVAELTSSGQVSAANMKDFGRVAVIVQRDIGRSVADTVKDFNDLGKSPVEASLKLNEAYHYLTASTYAQIKALQEQGRTDDAAEAAQKAYAYAFENRAKTMKDNLGLIEGAWREAKESAASAWDVFLGVGRQKSLAQQLAEVREQIALAKSAPSTAGGERSDAAEMRRAKAAAGLPQLEAREQELQWKVDKNAWDARQEGIRQQLEKDRITWDQELEKYLPMAERQKKEIARVTQLGEAAGASDAEIKKAVDKVKSNFASLNNVALTQLENQRDLQKEVMAGQAADLETQYKLQLISQDSYLAKKRDMQVKEIDLEIPILKKQAEIAGGKEDQSAREKALGELQVLLQRRANIISGAANAAKEADFARAKAVDNLVGGWDRAITAETDALAQEMALFGMSDQARQVAIAQIRLETDARKLIADQAKDGHALTEQEIADLGRKTEARKKSTAEVMYELAASAGAQQLLQENRKFSAEYIADEQVRAQRILDIDSQKWRELIENTAVGSEARQKLLEQFDQWYANRQMTPVLDRWKGVIDNLDNNFQEGFRDMLTNGQNAWSSFAKSIGNTLKTSLADALYQTFIKKYVVQIVAGFAGAISGPAVAGALTGTTPAGGVSAAGGAIGAVQTAAGLYSAFSSGLNGTLGSAISSAGNLFGSSAVSAFGSGLANGAAVGDAAAAYAAAGQTSVASSLSAGASIAPAVPIIAATVASYFIAKGIAGQYKVEGIGTALNYAGIFGGLINRAFGMGNKEVTGQGVSGTLSASSLTGQSYSTWHQDGGWFRSDKNGTDTKALTDAMVKQFTQGLAAIESASSSFASSLGVQADWIKDYSKVFDLKLTGDATKDQQAITDFFQGIGDEIAQKLVPNLNDFNKSGESLSATLQRLAGDFKGTDQVAQLLGFSADSLFGSSGLNSAKVREQLIEMAGGLSALSSQAAFFNQNFLSDAERIKPVAEALDKALASLGLSTIPTTRDEFKALVDNLITSGAAATETGGKQLTSLLALEEAFAQVHPQIDAAAEAAAKAAAAMQSMKDAASTLLGGVDDAFGALQKVVSREKTAIQSSIDAHSASVARLQSLSQALHSTFDGLASTEQKLAGRAMAQAEIRADLTITKAGGSLSDAQVESLKKALGLVTQDASSQFGSYVDYVRDLAQTQSDISQLAGVTDDSLSVEQRSLDALKDQLVRLDDIVANGQAQIDALKGQSIATLSLAQAIAALKSSIGAAQSNPVVAGTSAISGFYQDLLGRAPDQAGMQYWLDAVANGSSLDNIRTAIMDSDEYKQLRITPGVVSSGNQAASVMARAGAGDNGALLAEIKALRDEVKQLREATDRTADNTERHAEMFENATAGGKAPMLVEIAQ